ncbi:MAG: hypothetical protein ACYC6G_06405 [Desulfobaccales bacterium]
MMTQGVIIYLLGEEALDGLQTGVHYQGLSQPEGPLEVVISRQGGLDLDDAWHFLLSLGCETIHLLVAQAEQNRLRPLYPLVRLTGVTRGTEKPSIASLNRRILH